MAFDVVAYRARSLAASNAYLHAVFDSACPILVCQDAQVTVFAADPKTELPSRGKKPDKNGLAEGLTP